MNAKDELFKRLQDVVSEESARKVAEFYELVATENEQQNLTTLIEPQKFFEGHVLDVLELQRSGLISYPAMDLGSGAGVPGLLSAIIDPKPWILCESEGHKARFLLESVQRLGLNQIEVVASRAEAYLKHHAVDSIVCRAVGKVEKIYSWIGVCSTWNKLILLKGPAWEQEWEEFQRSNFRGRLQIIKEHRYLVGLEKKQRVIVQLERVPRGTR